MGKFFIALKIVLLFFYNVTFNDTIYRHCKKLYKWYNGEGGSMRVNFMPVIKKYYFPIIFSLIITLYQAFIYFMAKFTPFPVHAVGGQIDNIIPFLPVFIIPYVLWYLFLVMVPCVLYENDKSDFYWYITSTILINTVAVLIFVFYPTILIRPNFVVDNIFTWLLNIIYMEDTPALNCFPSIHCASCFSVIFIMLKGNKIKKSCKAFWIFSSVIIILSTLFIKQHALIDVVGAFFVSLLIVYFVKKTTIYLVVKQKVEARRKSR